MRRKQRVIYNARSEFRRFAKKSALSAASIWRSLSLKEKQYWERISGRLNIMGAGEFPAYVVLETSFNVRATYRGYEFVSHM